MKCRSIITILMLICLVQLVQAADVEVSADNITWMNVSTSCSLDKCSLIELNCSTLWYIRGRINESYEWTHLQQKTEACGLDEMPIAIILGLIFLTILFILLGVFNKLAFYRWASFIFAFYEVIIILAILYGVEAGINNTALLKFNLYVTMIIGFALLLLSAFSKSIVLARFDEEVPETEQIPDDKFGKGKY